MYLMLSEDKKCGGGCLNCSAGIRTAENMDISTSTLPDETSERICRLQSLPEYKRERSINLDIASGISQRIVDILSKTGVLNPPNIITDFQAYFNRKNTWLQREIYLRNYPLFRASRSETIIVPNNQNDMEGRIDEFLELINV